MDATHALFEPVGVPWDVVVEEDMAALKVDPLAGCFRRHQDLDITVPELLFGVRAGTPGSSREPGLMPPCIDPDAKSPKTSALSTRVAEGVLELRERSAVVGRGSSKNPCSRMISFRRVSLASSTCLPRQTRSVAASCRSSGNLIVRPSSAFPARRDRLQHPLQTLALCVLQLFQFLPNRGDPGVPSSPGSRACLRPSSRPSCPVFQRPAAWRGALEASRLWYRDIRKPTARAPAGRRPWAAARELCLFTNRVTDLYKIELRLRPC